MYGITEGPKRINPSKDLPIRFQCGCEVVFLGSCFLHTSRMTCCVDHSRRDAIEDRNRISDEARAERDRLLRNQPPM